MSELSPALLPLAAVSDSALRALRRAIPVVDLPTLGITRGGELTRAGAVALAAPLEVAPAWLQVVVRSWPCAAASARRSDVAPLERRVLGPPLLPQVVEMLASEITAELTPPEAPSLDPLRDIARELVRNAVIHRDYGPESVDASIDIDIYKGEVVISSPGGLVGRLVDADAPEAAARNAHLAHLAAAMGCGTQTGRGWCAALRLGRAYGYALAVLEREPRTTISVRVDLPRVLDLAASRAGAREARRRVPTDSWDAQVVELLADHQWWRPSQLVDRLGIPRSTLTQVMRRLQESGRVVAETVARRSRLQRYRLAGRTEG